MVIITADHGFIDSPPARRILLKDHPPLADSLTRPLCGESRAAFCYVKPQKRAQFTRYLKDHFAALGIAYPREQLLEEGWFGLGRPHPCLRDRIGDFALIMQENYTIKDWLPGEKQYTHIGVHGGLTEAEMLVPLITIRA
jgi:hypothetical protein